ncbi:lipase [Desertifilum sp. FACHB-1129]|uniref:Lipase n=1 Tax=Desertifilum tharense IPPAS B-1220 TaxID=1781255 RepID=A0A1E5QG65_9CYAN|nr:MULTISPECIES: alpha/beta fold hydrolase [Desertifilum]MDA0209293.1 lipase [Cyanobacteria bacterium FC1]MBD2315080.1 lipase [Desertifilum sp. FACHB-1129]MBD2325162.1 lipase [Desertifilum sp. FACHB-866]MBD2332696.1 lipase [Desertifilum sp. FACHB-868]OEJ73690.1 lipase [Desertifilum tharense IPPAS B-1220]
MTLPTVILPGYFAGAVAYRQMAQYLESQGFPTVVVPLRRRDWFPTVGGRSMVPILRYLDRTVKQLMAEHDAPKVNLIGHSAGGWIARIYLGEKPYCIHGDVTEEAGLWDARQKVATLVTLGTPHVSQERWTKRNLDFVKNNYPGAFYPDLRYVCIAGKAIFGQRRNWFVYSSYRLTCGVGDVWGDGITPVEAAHLEGAENITLDGVWHSPSNPGSWYGSAQIMDRWIAYLKAV